MDHARHYRALIDRARDRILSGYVERHHIVPKCLGGGDKLSNLVRLTPEEHCTAHLLLAKMYPENERVAFAAARMSCLCPDYRAPKNKRYAKGRKAARIILKGSNDWERTRRGNAIRARKRKQRYSAADVERLAKMLAPKTHSA